jgi:hypothetical protein
MRTYLQNTFYYLVDQLQTNCGELSLMSGSYHTQSVLIHGLLNRWTSHWAFSRFQNYDWGIAL